VNWHKAIQEFKSSDTYWPLRSDWILDENGSFNYITSLGVEKLPEIIEYVNQTNPFYVPALFAVNDICEINIYFTSIEQWKEDFSNNKVKATTEIIKLANNPKLSDNQINEIIKQYGILSLPEIYNQVINNSNDWLLDYIYYALPNEIKKNITADTKEHEIQLSTLKDCGKYINIIKSL